MPSTSSAAYPTTPVGRKEKISSAQLKESLNGILEKVIILYFMNEFWTFLILGEINKRIAGCANS